ncbi:MAG: hypothetical protein ACLP01_25540 [Solirubrobacteraceae bacterium]
MWLLLVLHRRFSYIPVDKMGASLRFVSLVTGTGVVAMILVAPSVAGVAVQLSVVSALTWWAFCLWDADIADGWREDGGGESDEPPRSPSPNVDWDAFDRARADWCEVPSRRAKAVR